MILTDVKHIPEKQPLPPLRKGHDKEDPDVFEDNIEHLEALEYISRLRLARAYLLGGGALQQSPGRHRHGFRKPRNPHEPPAILFPEISEKEVTLDEIETALNRLETATRTKVKRSLERGVELHFQEFCRSYNLDSFEQTVLALLVANSTGKAFRISTRSRNSIPTTGKTGG